MSPQAIQCYLPLYNTRSRSRAHAQKEYPHLLQLLYRSILRPLQNLDQEVRYVYASLSPLVSLLLLLGVLILSACVTALADDDDGRKVVGGYFEEWSIYFAGFNIANLQANGVADRLTHLNYAFGGVNTTGCFIADSWADYQSPFLPSITGPYTGPLYGNFAALQQLKQLHPNLKVLISLAGADGFSAAAATEAGRQALRLVVH